MQIVIKLIRLRPKIIYLLISKHRDKEATVLWLRLSLQIYGHNEKIK